MSDLRALIEAVEAGTAKGQFAMLCANAGIGEHAIDAARANSGDLNAAKALHEALLPGWCVSDLSQDGTRAENPWGCVLEDWDLAATERRDKRRVTSHYDYSNPARAWLLAILRAKEASHE